MLSIYRASAGAGKTHRLTGEYLLLLFSQPGAYRNILAVTFTNKATDEMKGRIVEELFNLANGRSSDYLALLGKRYKLSEDEVRSRAYNILVAILHDYSAFNVSTIDRFFQQTMRSFTREIGLQGGYGIEMDEDIVLTEAVDRLLADLNKPENRDLLGWLLRFAEDKIEDGGDWKLRKDIQSLGKELFKESYKASSDLVSQDISDKQSLENFKKILHGIIRSTEKEVRLLGERAMGILELYGLKPEDFSGGSRSPFIYFRKYKNGEMKAPTNTFCALADNVGRCYTAKTSQALKVIIETAFNDGLNECVVEIVEKFQNMTDYHTAKEIIRYYYTLGILNDISKQIAIYREEKNVMLIADTTELLNKVIDGSDAPFIYEKTGIQINHYMIDEFQDTSGMQWKNFRPLVEESLSHNRDNLIVGDVKQSIYRFRNSDWNLLDGQVASDFPEGEVREETLKDNWRSCRHIVEFNNALFTIAPYLLQSLYNDALPGSSLNSDDQEFYSTRIMAAYRNCYQRVPKPFREKGGHVQVRFIVQGEENNWKEDSLAQLPGILQQLQTKGYELKDIAILVRTNGEGAAVANCLLDYKEKHTEDGFHYDILSDEALFVNSASSVRFLVTFLQYLESPGNVTRRQMALLALQSLSGNWTLRDFPLEKIDKINGLMALPLYEMAEKAFLLFSEYIPDNEQVFVMAFLDLVAAYEQKETGDLGAFLEWWNETGYKKTISTPDGQNAIRILTVHKSKGLGFKVVILPFSDWEIDHKPTKPVVLWCRSQVKPFNQIHLLPVRYGLSLANTHFAADYFKEKLHAFIDNLNTLYVALTRAKEEMILLAPKPKKLNKDGEVEKISGVADLMWESFRQDVQETAEGEKLISLKEAFRLDEGWFELGDDWFPEKKNIIREISEIEVGTLQVIPFNNRLHLRLKGKNYFFDDVKRKHGTLMHELLSCIRTTEDIVPTLHQYQVQGVINSEEEIRLRAQIGKYLENPKVRHWYNGKAKVLNETEILLDRGITRRPDRIMIYPDEVVILDYKFGEKKLMAYSKQMRSYMKLVTQMGYGNVHGYIWYVTLGEIESVELSSGQNYYQTTLFD